jgi:hypothetical protein
LLDFVFALEENCERILRPSTKIISNSPQPERKRVGTAGNSKTTNPEVEQ